MKTPVPESQKRYYRCFLVNFAKFLRTSFLQNTSRRLFLKLQNNQTTNHSCLPGKASLVSSSSLTSLSELSLLSALLLDVVSIIDGMFGLPWSDWHRLPARKLFRFCCKLSRLLKWNLYRFSWSAFSLIQTEYGDLLHKSPYSLRIRENTDQKKLHTCTPFTQWLNLWKHDVYCLSKPSRRKLFLKN